MRHGPYLQRRGDAFRFRFRLPNRLASFLDRSEIVVALRTANRVVASRRARLLRVAVETLMLDLSKPSLTRLEADRLVRGWIDRCRDAFERRLASTGVAFLNADDVGRMGAEQARELDMLLRSVAEVGAVPQFQAEIRHALSGLNATTSPDLDAVAATAFAEIAPDIDPASADGLFLRRSILRGFATYLDEQTAVARGDLTPVASVAALPAAAIIPRAPELLFLAKWQEFSASKGVESAWDASTQSNARSSRNLFDGLYPDTPIAAIDRRLAADFRGKLFRLPKYYDKSFKGMTLEAATVEADRRDAKAKKDAKPGVPRLQLATVDKHFSNLIEYWRWLAKTGVIPPALDCPFSGFIQPKAQGRAARDKRSQWPLDMQKTLFSSPVWAGCQSIHRRKRPGTEIHRDALFWAPILGRLLGAREDEICSRLVGDIRLESDIQYAQGETGRAAIFYLHIEDSKTEGSTRDLPLPDQLLALGFLEYRVLGRDPSEPLFPELIPQGAGSCRGAPFSKRFTEYRRGVSAYAPLVDFQSFRANVATDMQNMPGLNLGWADEITGHISKIRSSVRTLYSKGVLLNNLLDTLNRIRFPVDLSHLIYEGPKGQMAVGARKQIALFTTLAEREMQKKAERRKENG